MTGLPPRLAFPYQTIQLALRHTTHTVDAMYLEKEAHPPRYLGSKLRKRKVSTAAPPARGSDLENSSMCVLTTNSGVDTDLSRPPFIREPLKIGFNATTVSQLRGKTHLEPNGDTGGPEIDEKLMIPSVEAGVPLHDRIPERITALSVYAEQYHIRQISLGKRIGSLSLILALGDAAAAAATADALIQE